MRSLDLGKVSAGDFYRLSYLAHLELHIDAALGGDVDGTSLVTEVGIRFGLR